VTGCGGTTSVGAGAAGLVPASAPAFIAIDADPSSAQWRTINSLAAKFPDKQKAVDSIKRDMRKDGVEWGRDVEPVLQGEADFVWLDFADNGENFVILFRPKSEAKFKQIIRKANTSEKNPDDRVVYEKFRGWEVMASKHETIDRFKQASKSEATSLADDKSFMKSMDRLGHDAVVRAYINGRALMKLARRRGGAQARPYLEKLGTLDWIAARLGATSEGVHLDAIVHGTPGKLFRDAATSPAFSPKLIGTVPADALLYLSFHGTKGMFGGLQQQEFFKDAPQFRQFAGPLRQLGRILEGENAIYIRPGTARSPDVPFAIPEVTLVSTPSRDGTAIVDRMVKRYAGGPPQLDTVGGTSVHLLARNGLGLYYANVDGKLVVTDQPQGIRGVKSGPSLSDSDEFKQAKAASGLPDKNWGVLYVDIKTSIPYGEKLARQHIPAEVARNLKPLRSAVEYAASHTHEFQLGFFLRIK
jgi:Protein of unknown function (DUF3352)